MLLLLFLPAGFSSRLPVQFTPQALKPALLLLGSTDSSVFPDFVDAAIARSQQNLVDILVLPSGLSPDPLENTSAERQVLLAEVEKQTRQIAAICSLKITAPMHCRVSFAPILVRSDAQSLSSQDIFSKTLSAVLILETEPYLTARVINGTPVERQLSEAYYSGVLIAGGKYLSRSQIIGYAPDFALESSLDFGAVEVEVISDVPTNPFQVRDAFLVTGFFQADSVGQMINALTLPGFPQLGIGIEQSGGIQLISNRTLQNPTGKSLVPIFDAETYHASETARYVGPQNTLSLRNILVHTLAAGEFSYDLLLRRHSMSPPADRLHREFEGLGTPARAGILMLSGKLDYGSPLNPVLSHFINLAGGQNSRLKVIVAGYPSLETARFEAAAFENQVGVPVEIQYILRETGPEITIPGDVTGLVILARYPSLLTGIKLDPVENAWRAGLPLLAVDAGASLAGSYMVTQELPAALDPGSTNRLANFGLIRLEPGMDLVNLNIEPQVNEENRWGRWLHLAYSHPGRLAAGLSSNSAIVVTHSGVFTIGELPVALLDLSTATLGLGDSAQLMIANGLMDIFAPGEIVYPQNADINASPIRLTTPPGPPPTTLSPLELPAPTTTPTIETAPTPTGSEFLIPVADLPVQPEVLLRPPPGQILTVLLVALPVLVVMIILAGLWLNRKFLK